MWFLNDAGLICNLGEGPAALSSALLHADTPLPPSDALFQRHGPYRVGGVNRDLPTLPAALAQFECRNNRLARIALDQVSDTLAALRERHGADRIGVVMATSTSGIDATTIAVTARASGQRLPGYHPVQGLIGGLGEFTARYLNLQGPCYTLSTACSSSANALLSARRLLQLGVCDVVVVGGADSLCELTLQGFGALEAQAQEIARPFSRHRDGINIGEAAAVFILSGERAAIAFEGGASSSDAHHISAPHPGGRGAIAAMSRALEDAGLQPGDIDYLNLHGTGTPQNDAMEATAVTRVFGHHLACSTTKVFTGHCLGAASALELAICYQLLSDSAGTLRLPPTPPIYERDSELEPIALTGQNDRSDGPLRHCMSNSFAFGGSNASLIIGRAYD